MSLFYLQYTVSDTMVPPRLGFLSGQEIDPRELNFKIVRLPRVEPCDVAAPAAVVWCPPHFIRTDAQQQNTAISPHTNNPQIFEGFGATAASRGRSSFCATAVPTAARANPAPALSRRRYLIRIISEVCSSFSIR